MDNNKINHADLKVVSGVIELLESYFGKMTVDRGKVHKCVGMDFELLDSGKLKIVMRDYLEECIKSFGEDIKTTISSRDGHNLFTVDNALDRLDTRKSEIFAI